MTSLERSTDTVSRLLADGSEATLLLVQVRQGVALARTASAGSFVGSRRAAHPYARN